MLTVFRESLPESYLLVVASQVGPRGSHALDRALHRAGRSGKPAVWLDCSLLAPQDVTRETCLVLRAYHDAYTRMGIRLLIAHASPELQQGLAAAGEANAPAMVDWLVEDGPTVVEGPSRRA